MTETRKGRLTVVGTGMMLGAHISAIARSEIEAADRVFCLTDGATESWIGRLNPEVVSLQPHYAVGKYRPDSYRAMIEDVLAALRTGRSVCLALYGHPGVYALIGHRAIAIARAEGHDCRMEPGISAEDCLYADLGLDPGTHGCQSYEATAFLMRDVRIDPAALLLLWQIALVGETSLTRFDTDPERIGILVDKLVGAGYPRDHRVILYRAAMLALETPHIAHIALIDLPRAEIDPLTTLVLPPARRAAKDEAVGARLGALEKRAAPRQTIDSNRILRRYRAAP